MMSESLNKLSSLDETTKVYCTHEYTLANLTFATAADPGNEKLRARLAVEQEAGTRTTYFTLTIQLERRLILLVQNADIIQVLQQRSVTSLETPRYSVQLRGWKDNF